MIKRLLTLVAAAAAISFGAKAATVTLWEGSCNFGTSWSESFAIAAADLKVLPADNAVLTLEYTLDSNETYWQYKPINNISGWPALDAGTSVDPQYGCISVEAGSTTTNLVLGAADIAKIKENGLRFQGYGMTMTKVSTDTDAEVNENLLWEGELVLDNWNSGAEFASSKVKAGDIICYTFDPATAAGQVLLKNSSWANLMGSTKITPADMEAGNVYVGITEEMLSDCGGKIFLQGEGKCKVTKVEKTGETFNPAGIIAYGKRNPGVEFYTKIPESATTVAVVFDKTPEWAAFCAGGWTDSELACTVTTNSDNTVTYTYTLTADAISKVNAGSTPQFIINGSGAAVLYAYYPDQAGIADITVDENAPVEFYNLQGVRVANPENGLYIRRQGNKATKVFVK